MEFGAKLRITIDELPPRTHRLTVEEQQGVFGGCVMYGGLCYNSSDCCSGVECLQVARAIPGVCRDSHNTKIEKEMIREINSMRH